jgi:hypothetical protein
MYDVKEMVLLTCQETDVRCPLTCYTDTGTADFISSFFAAAAA